MRYGGYGNLKSHTSKPHFYTYRKTWKINCNYMGTYTCVWSAEPILPNTARLRITVFIERWTAPGLRITAVHLLSILQYLTAHISHMLFRHATCSQVALYIIHCRLKELLWNNVTVTLQYTAVAQIWSKLKQRQFTFMEQQHDNV
jgi:hypothetical protein